MRGIKICSSKGQRPFSRRNNDEIAKDHWRTNRPISIKHGTKHPRPWMKTIKFNQKSTKIGTMDPLMKVFN